MRNPCRSKPGHDKRYRPHQDLRRAVRVQRFCRRGRGPLLWVRKSRAFHMPPLGHGAQGCCALVYTSGDAMTVTPSLSCPQSRMASSRSCRKITVVNQHPTSVASKLTNFVCVDERDGDVRPLSPRFHFCLTGFAPVLVSWFAAVPRLDCSSAH